MLTVKQQRRLKRYEEDLAMPRRKYILIYGITWGVLIFIFTTLSDLIFYGKSLQWNFGLLARFLITSVVGGITFGWIMRKLVIREYMKLKVKAD